MQGEEYNAYNCISLHLINQHRRPLTTTSLERLTSFSSNSAATTILSQRITGWCTIFHKKIFPNFLFRSMDRLFNGEWTEESWNHRCIVSGKRCRSNCVHIVRCSSQKDVSVPGEQNEIQGHFQLYLMRGYWRCKIYR